MRADWDEFSGDLDDSLDESDPLEAVKAMRKEDLRRRSHAAEVGHVPVQESESVDAVLGTMIGTLAEGLYVDGTFGRGGHSRSVLARLAPTGRLRAFDVDPRAIEVARALEEEDPRFKIFHRPFGEMEEALQGEEVDGVLMDLGVSNNQAEDDLRISDDTPLDLRLNPSHGVPAADWLQEVSVEELAWVIYTYGEDDPVISDRIAERVLRHQRQRGRSYRSTGELAEVIKAVKRWSFPLDGPRPGKYMNQVNPAKKTLNGIRVFLNRELQQLEEGLVGAMNLLKMGGRCAVLTFSPPERRVVHEFFRNHEDAPPEDVRELSPQRLVELYPLAATCCTFSVKRRSTPRTAGGSEFAMRPRARSSALLVLQKCPRTCPMPSDGSALDVVPPVADATKRFREPLAPRLRGA